MTIISTEHETNAILQPTRKAWQAPAIVLERSLEVAAQGGPPGGAPGGFLGPLGTSGNSGTCVITTL